jgi:polysaccharide biosynthesis/export protein
MHSPAPLPRIVVAALAIPALLLGGCATFKRKPAPDMSPAAVFTPTPVADLPSLDAALLQKPNTEYRLGPGDQVDIEILGDVDTQTTATVGPDGKIYFYVLPGIDVWGLTLTQARERIVDGLQKYVREKQPVSVSLRLAGSQRVWILGRLNKPGVYSMAAPMTLLEAISEAGGLSPANAIPSLAGPVPMSAGPGAANDDAADLGRAFVIRQGKLLRVDFKKLIREGDLSQNIYLQPDDFVYLPSGSAGTVHVLGAVTTPRAIETSNRLTLVQAVAQAGGTIKDAYPSHVAIVRGSLTQPKVAIVDFNAVAQGRESDVVLEPEDIVYVPFTPYRVLTRYVDMILDTFVRTVGVNQGSRAVSGQNAAVGVNVPVGPL